MPFSHDCSALSSGGSTKVPRSTPLSAAGRLLLLDTLKDRRRVSYGMRGMSAPRKIAENQPCVG